MKFLSNCLGLRDFTLEAFYKKEFQLSEEKHPKVLVLKLFRNIYKLTFSNSAVANKKSILRSIDYRDVTITPTVRGKYAKYDLTKENRIFLKPKVQGELSKEKIEKLMNRKNPIACSLRKNMTEMHCKVI